MSLVKFNAMQPAFSGLFENFFGRDAEAVFNLARVGTGAPAVNVKEDNASFHVELAAPGFGKEDFKVTLDNNLLTISAERHANQETQHEAGRYTRREFSYGSFSRAFTLPGTVEADRIDARYQDGILHLSIPKKEEAKRRASRRIAIA